MAKYLGPVCKLCRREGEKLFLKGERCFTPKCGFEKRSFAPGVHGKSGSRSRSATGRESDFARQLRAKQKARLLGLPETEIAALETYARKLGLAFQITDDVLDARTSDEDAHKATFANCLGMEHACREADLCITEAMAALEPYGLRAEPLLKLAEYVRTRTT